MTHRIFRSKNQAKSHFHLNDKKNKFCMFMLKIFIKFKLLIQFSHHLGNHAMDANENGNLKNREGKSLNNCYNTYF